jgi:signal transduction histidine kinase/FixJ family two-component response regulator
MEKHKGQIRRQQFLAGGGEMGNRISDFNWKDTSLGAIEAWPQSLKTSVSLMLNSQHPMWIGWGEKACFLYNDAYIDILSLSKHPLALGMAASEVWSEIWDVCGPLADKVFRNGEASYMKDVRLFMNRGEFLEETFYSFSYSPIWDESGEVGGLFCPSTDVTPKNLNTRRLRILSDLAAESLVQKSTDGACASAATILAKSRDDIPFALLYLVEDANKTALLKLAVGLQKGNGLISPLEINLKDSHNDACLWPIAEVVRTAVTSVISLHGVAGFPLGPAEQVVGAAVVLPLVSRGQERPLGVMVAGVNPTRRLDPEYRSFYDLVAGHVATAIQNAQAAAEEKRRADGLAELDRAKTIFFSNVSHELRTPLTLILGPLEDEMRESPAPRERLELAHRNSLRLLKLVNTLLDFSRIEAGRVEASYEPTDLAAFTSELASVFRAGIEKVGLRLILDCLPLSEPVYIDREMWEKIVYNLLSNAFKFTARGEIEVRVFEVQSPAKTDQSSQRTSRLTKSHVCLSVRDTGIGISAAELSRIFERFHRTKTTWARSHEGTGIGLALVQELARLHGGHAGVESKEGVGTTFTVAIPMGMTHLPKDRIGTLRKLNSTGVGAGPFVDETLRWGHEDTVGENAGSHSSSRPSTSSSVSLSFAGGNEAEEALRSRSEIRIVMADDNSDMRGYVQRLLLNEGYNVIAVGDGELALKAVRTEKTDLVLSDVMMPCLDGIGLLNELRNDRVTRDIPVIMLSARAGEEARVEGVAAGANDYLTKPFSARELLARVASHLKFARVRKEAQIRADFVGQLTQKLSVESDADELNRIATREIGRFLNAAKCYFFQDIGKEDLVRVLPDWREVQSPTLAGDYQLSKFGLPAWREALQAGSLSIDDVQLSPFTHDFFHNYKDLNIASYIFAPFIHEGRWVACLAVTSDRPRFWTDDEKALLENVVARVWPLIERARVEEALRESEEALRQANSLLANKAAHLETVVQQRTIKLQETVGELEAFSYSIAHDMRAPLRSLTGFSQMLLSDYSGVLDDVGKDYLKRISTSAGRMDKLIQDVLNYSKVVRSDQLLVPVNSDLLLRGIVDTYPILAHDAANIILIGTFPIVLGNEAMLTQVFSNLMGNAVKFFSPGKIPHLKVWFKLESPKVRIFFEDSGIGIPADQHEKIFEIFQQVEKGQDGTGIGLAIVKKAVERMGGKVSVQSEMGKGSTFIVEFQLA